jgi:uncharacterized protein with HEPN domain
MSDSPGREWRFYLDDMIGFAEKVLAYSQGFDQAGFVAHAMAYDATVRNLELIGEAATHIPDSVRQANPHIPWRLIIATRNRLIHGSRTLELSSSGITPNNKKKADGPFGKRC